MKKLIALMLLGMGSLQLIAYEKACYIMRPYNRPQPPSMAVAYSYSYIIPATAVKPEIKKVCYISLSPTDRARIRASLKNMGQNKRVTEGMAHQFKNTVTGRVLQDMLRINSRMTVSGVLNTIAPKI